MIYHQFYLFALGLHGLKEKSRSKKISGGHTGHMSQTRRDLVKKGLFDSSAFGKAPAGKFDQYDRYDRYLPNTQTITILCLL